MSLPRRSDDINLSLPLSAPMVVSFLPTLIVVRRDEVQLPIIIIDVSAVALGRYGVHYTSSISSATVTE